MNRRFIVFLVCLVLLSYTIPSLTLSRYTSAVSGSGKASAAQVIVEYVPGSATLNGNPVNVTESGISVGIMKPGDVLVYDFEIRNYKGSSVNQVKMNYNIGVSFSSGPNPLSYQLTLGGSAQSSGVLGYNSPESHSYLLTVTWSTYDMDIAYLNRQQNIQIQLYAEQSDI